VWRNGSRSCSAYCSTRRSDVMSAIAREEESRILHDIAALTASICEAVERDEFDKAAVLLKERRVFVEALGAVRSGRRGADETARRKEVEDRMRAEERRMFALLKLKRTEVLDRLKEAQKRKAVAAYSQ
jgi:hypothetical protein